MNNILEKKQRRKAKRKYDSISYTTGSIQANIDRFNKAMGSFQWGDNGFSGSESTSSSECSDCNTGIAGGLGEALLTETKRYVRRYYIRPQNIFCSNKAEIVKALIDLDNANCSVYTLNNLGDEKDVSKLMNSDIIYYYDNGILYDKNRVKVMDYDLSIKKEENRKHFANVDKAPEKEFKAEYEDRMTDATELEESLSLDIFNDCDYDVINAGYTDKGELIVTLNNNVSNIEHAGDDLMFYLERHGIYTIDWNTNGSNVFIFTLAPDNSFDLHFDTINAYGEKLTEAKQLYCCICGEPLEDHGNNPEPFMHADSGRCCDGCNLKFVIPMRLGEED